MIHFAVLFAVSLGLTASDLHRLRSVREVAIRPDGGAILFTELDSSGRGQPESKLMIYDRATGSVRPFRSSGLSGSSPRWSPNGERVALLGTHDGAFGLVVTDARGGGERLVAKVEGTNHPLPSSGETVAWAPDSTSLAFISATPGPEADEATGDPVVIRRYLYKPTASEGETRFNDNRRHPRVPGRRDRGRASAPAHRRFHVRALRELFAEGRRDPLRLEPRPRSGPLFQL
jgi:dipeptidyl aminopeptidase/acylaminoacyl peptidase